MGKTIKLNAKQQEAVDYIYGPLLVLAGPGTGKTQLLSARIAHILEKTDTNAHNILCLTFTDNAAANMRERLTSLIRDSAYDVHIATYHSFGSDIIKSYSRYFEEINLETGKDSRLERPIDDLQRFQIIHELINSLPYSSPLIGARHYVKNIISTISDLKRSLYTPETLHKLATQNLAQCQDISPHIKNILSGIKKFPSKAHLSIPIFEQIEIILRDYDGLAGLAHTALTQALLDAEQQESSKPLTKWKDDWIQRRNHEDFVFGDYEQQERMVELAKIYAEYSDRLMSKNLYDYDDMILRTIQALRENDDLRFSLQEKYQFILLDEFQDTNAAQFELVKLLADNPVHEGQPNIFAVGDDDQAIYAFQGANVSNMKQFCETFRDVKVINLSENYRSHPDIIHTAHGIAGQIESRLHHEIEGITKELTAVSVELPAQSVIERHEFIGEADEYAWVANKINDLIKSGIKPHEIAVLAPKHALLESLVPFLTLQKTPVMYEKRENILDTQLMKMIKTMCELVNACSANDSLKIDELLPQVLSYDFFEIPVEDIWRINWAMRNSDMSWAEKALELTILRPHVLFFLALGLRAPNEPLEYVIDFLMGSTEISIGDGDDRYTSPFKDYYFRKGKEDVLTYYESISNLSTIREHIRTWQRTEEKLLTIPDFLSFIRAYEIAEEPILNTHPLSLAEESVQLMTVYKAKGLEFEHVFLLSVHDDIWGKGARGQVNNLSLPTNLKHIRYKGSDEDELKRLLFVAITRAKIGLYMTSYARKDNGKSTMPVKYLREYSEGEMRYTTVLPKDKQVVNFIELPPSDSLTAVDTLWHQRHIKPLTSLKNLIAPRLAKFQLSPTNLNAFTDLTYGGPEQFVLQSILRFPQAPGVSGEYGNAVHYALERYQTKIIQGAKPTINTILRDFDDSLSKRYVPKEQMQNLRAKGHYSLTNYIEQRKSMFMRTAHIEVPFAHEGVTLGSARLTGKIDRLEVNERQKTIQIIDFKTGHSHSKWDKEVKLLKYQQQLYFYKILVENSSSWSNYRVEGARLEFVEPNGKGEIAPPLEVVFNDKDEASFKELIQAVWDCIQTLDLPDTAQFKNDYSGVVAFIESLTQQS